MKLGIKDTQATDPANSTMNSFEFAKQNDEQINLLTSISSDHLTTPSLSFATSSFSQCRSTASDKYTEILRKEKLITEERQRLAAKFEAQKSNFEVSKSLNFPLPLAKSTSGITSMETLMSSAVRIPVKCTSGWHYSKVSFTTAKAIKPRTPGIIQFPNGPPRHLKARPPIKPNAQNNVKFCLPPFAQSVIPSNSSENSNIGVGTRRLVPHCHSSVNSSQGLGNNCDPNSSRIDQRPPFPRCIR